MKKFFVFFTFIMTLVIVNPSYAIDPGFYVGAGGVYSKLDFDIRDEFDSTIGINLKAGYRVNDICSWELSFDHLPGFNWKNPTNYKSLKAKVNINTIMIVSKIAPDFGLYSVKPFIMAGLGLMHSKLKIEDTNNTKGFYASAYEINPCFKLGAGVDYFVKDNMALNAEISYVLGTGTLAVKDSRHINYTFGVAYYF